MTEFTAHTVSPLVNGEARLTITENALTVATSFDAAEIPFAEIDSLVFADYVITLITGSGKYIFSKMGSWCQPFHDSLYQAYNRAVLRSLFVKGPPLISAKGEYRYTEAKGGATGSAPVYVFENSVVVLPPDLGARRVPLCFVSGIDKGDFEITLKTSGASPEGICDTYTFAKLGYETDPFIISVEKQIRELREKSLAAAKELDSSLSASQTAQIAKLMPEGAAASFGQITEIAPSFAAALESKIAKTRSAESYRAFRELTNPARIYIGFRKNEVNTESIASPVPDADGNEAARIDPYLLWLIAPSPNGDFAAVEFAEAGAATFIYKTNGDFDNFARQLNRALEAINFRREAIRLTDEELRKPENSDYYMAAKRTAALRFIRSSFASRIIHSSVDSWKRKLSDMWNG